MGADEFDDLIQGVSKAISQPTVATANNSGESYEKGIELVRYASMGRAFLQEQAHVILRCFTPRQDCDPDLRPEAFVILYSR
jgi:hypothetical protein